MMRTIKEEAMHALSSLPDDAPMDEIMYRLYVLDKIRKAQEAVIEGRTLTTEMLQKEIETW